MAADDRHSVAAAAPGWGVAAQAMYRAAQAVARPGGPGLFADLVQELATVLPAACVFVAVFTDERRLELRTLAAVLDGKPLREFTYPVRDTPCAQVVGHTFRYVASGVAVEFPPDTILGAKGMDAYAAFPLNDSRGTPLAPGMCAGFKAGTGDAHQLLNPTDEMVVYLEVGDRSAGDAASYPDDDLQAVVVEGRWVFAHKDGRPY